MSHDIQESFEARRLIKVFAGILQFAGIATILAGIVNIFAPFGFPSWAMYVGLVCFFVGMLGGMRLTLFRKQR